MIVDFSFFAFFHFFNIYSPNDFRHRSLISEFDAGGSGGGVTSAHESQNDQSDNISCTGSLQSYDSSDDDGAGDEAIADQRNKR